MEQPELNATQSASAPSLLEGQEKATVPVTTAQATTTQEPTSRESEIWEVPAAPVPPQWLRELVRRYSPGAEGCFAAQLLWQRGWHNRDDVEKFLDFTQYSPCEPFCFEGEMRLACDRIQLAIETREKVAIWGDFDADGITATAVLFEGLGHWFSSKPGPEQRLMYYIPNRLTESHGLSLAGLEKLRDWGTNLVITCDTGSTDGKLIDVASSMGMEVIVTDHHSLPTQRPNAVALINPRSFEIDHPLSDLSGVAVAYKLIEALVETLGPKQYVAQASIEKVAYSTASSAVVSSDVLTRLLPLVAIGLIADLVALRGDCRYLAQRGLKELQKLTQRPQQRPGVAYLLERCKRSGDRPTDISFGIGPRINAVSRILGDANLCVELLTSRDSQRCKALVDQVELLNTRRKALQRSLAEQVERQLATLDLSTMGAIVLWERGWPIGVLGLVASQIAREYGKPTVLLSLDEIGGEGDKAAIARGSARSVNDLNFYPILESQRHLLHSFGGHPFAAGMSLAEQNLKLFAQGINQVLRAQQFSSVVNSTVRADLIVTVADLGQPLFRELKLLEPCGMGNPVPKLLIQNCRFENPANFNIKDWRGGKVRYIKTIFELKDESSAEPFPGIWWGHYQDELLAGHVDVIGELDFNTHRKQYEFRLAAVRPSHAVHNGETARADWIWDWRQRQSRPELLPNPQQPATSSDAAPIVMATSPQQWTDFGPWITRAKGSDRPLALAYAGVQTDAQTAFKTLLGIIKYLNRTGEAVAIARLEERLGINLRREQGQLMELMIGAIAALGFDLSCQEAQITIQRIAPPSDGAESVAVSQFLTALEEVMFLQRYFAQVPVEAIARRAEDWI